MKFSPCGRLLAVGTSTNNHHILQVFDSCSGALLCVFASHQSIIYSIDFHKINSSSSTEDYDYEIATASSDCSVKVWWFSMQLWSSPPNSNPPLIDTPLLTYALSSFAYQAAYHPLPHAANNGGPLLIVACYSGHLALLHSDSADPVEQLDDHTSNDSAAAVLSLCWSPQGDLLYTSDSRGLVRVWQDRLVARTIGANWSAAHPQAYKQRIHCIRVIDTARDAPPSVGNGLGLTAAIQVIVCPNPSRLCVLLQSGRILIWNASTWRLHQVVEAPTNSSLVRGRCKLSPDGRWLVLGMPNGQLCFVSLIHPDSNTKTLNTTFSQMPSDIDWHPLEHAIAACMHQPNQPVIVFETNPPPVPVPIAQEAMRIAFQR